MKPSDGATVAVPSQDMILGIYYLTLDKDGEMVREDILSPRMRQYLHMRMVELHFTPRSM
ncbi:MAG: hypothetical protein ACLTDF_12300 [Coprococcus sp.]